VSQPLHIARLIIVVYCYFIVLFVHLSVFVAIKCLVVAVLDVAVAVCSTVGGHHADKADLPSKCYIAIGANNRY